MNTNQPVTPTSNRNTLLFKLEQDIAKLLLTKLEHFEITFERASQIAKFILSHLPEDLTDEQVIQILPTLDDEFIELASIVHKHMVEYEEKYKEKITQGIEDLIRHKHFDEASRLAKEYFSKKFIA